MTRTTQTLTIASTFHRTATTVRIPASADPVEWQSEVSPAVRKRVRRQLCGLSDCKCGSRVSEVNGVPFRA